MGKQTKGKRNQESEETSEIDSEDVLDNQDIKVPVKKYRAAPQKTRDQSIVISVTPQDYLNSVALRSKYAWPWRDPIRTDESVVREQIAIYIERCFEEESYEHAEITWHDKDWYPINKYSVRKRIIMKHLPTISWLAIFLWTSRKTLYEYKGKPGFSDTLMNFMDYIEDLTIQMWLHWKVNQNIMEMLLYTNYWYSKQKREEDPNKWLWLVWDVLNAILESNDNRRIKETEEQERSIIPWEPERVDEMTQHIDISQKQQSQSSPRVIDVEDKNAPPQKRTPRFYHK